MKKFKVLLFFCALVVCTSMFAQKAMMRPKIFENSKVSDQWSEIAQSRRWGKLSDQAWKVYADRDGVEVYRTASFTQKTGRTLSFLEPIYISQISGDFALVYKSLETRNTKEYNTLSGEIGWVEIDKLLLWQTCPKTINQTYQKAIILTNLSSKNRDKSKIKERIHLYNSPESLTPNNDKIKELEFFYVYKYWNGYALLLKTEKVDDSGQDSKGWTDKYTNWNTRVCYEPNWGIGSTYAVVFDKDHPEQAKKFSQRGIFDPDDTIRYSYVWYEKAPIERWELSIPRLPILSKDDKADTYEIDKVGTIASLSSGPAQSAAIGKSNTIREKIKKINIVIVMDGTKSMQKYYEQMCTAIRQAMSNIVEQNINTRQVKFGAVIYQNEKDGNPKVQGLTTADNVIKFLSNHTCGSIATDHYEAMFEGLSYAVNKIAWDSQASNFIILVGDAASQRNNRLNLNEQKIGQLLASKNINFVAFQANHFDHPAYDDYSAQVTNIMYAETKSIYNRKITIQDFKINKNSQEFKENSIDEAENPMRFSFIDASISSIGNKAKLENQIVRNINDFIDIQKRQLEIYDNQIEAAKTGGTLNRKVLKRRNLTDEEIDALSNAVFNTDGYTCNFANDKEVLVPSVFLTDDEYRILVHSFKQIANITTNKRQNLQNGLLALGKSFLGETNVNMSVNDLMKKLFDLDGVVEIFPGDVTIKNITEPTSVTNSQIDDFIDQAKADVKQLETKGSRSRFEQNGLLYYYILVSDLPFQKH